MLLILFINFTLYIYFLQAYPFLQYHLLTPENSHKRCMKNPVKKRLSSIIWFLFQDLHIFGKFVENELPKTKPTIVPTTTVNIPTIIASINKL